MNGLLLAVGAIFLISMIVGVCRGAIKIAVSLGATILTLVVVFFATPYVVKAIEKFTPLDNMIQNQVISTMANVAASTVADGGDEEDPGVTSEQVEKALNAAGVSKEALEEYGVSIDDIVNGDVTKEDLEQYGISSSVLDGLGKNVTNEIADAIKNADIPRDMQIAAIKAADLPDVFKTLLTTNNNEEIYKKLGAKTFAEYVGDFLAKLIINIVSFLVTFVIITIIVRAIVFALDFVSELPGVGFVNRLAGGAVGAVGALIIVWTLFVVITLLYVTDFGKELFRMINADTFLRTLYEYNPIMKLATIFR